LLAIYGSVSFGAGGMVGGLLSGYTWDNLGAPLTYSERGAALEVLRTLEGLDKAGALTRLPLGELLYDYGGGMNGTP